VLIVALSLAPHAAPVLTITTASRSMQPGELVVLTVTTTEPVEAIRARAFDRVLAPYAVDARTWRMLVGIDLDVVPGTYAVTVEAGVASKATSKLVVLPKAFPTRNLKVDEAFVNPPASVQDRIARDARELDRRWTHSSTTRLWTEPFVRPVSDPANSAFGTRSVYNGQARSPHAGADFLSAAGTPVKAPNAGRVVLAEDLYYTGNTVIIDHGLGLFSVFAHFSVIDVHEGDTVVRGAIVGKVGATGRVTGPHLHWTVRAGGARIDPLSLLAMLGSPAER
jgi:murein DD-endopeptidase MepM/ murein hydrolase activator NlpD